jgi:hypothetical protein
VRLRGPLPLSPAQQLLLLKSACAGYGGAGVLRHGKLTWEFDARPTPLSRSYRLRISYRHVRTPEVFVMSPHLSTLAEGRKLPHVYQQDPPKLCLYLPGSGEWTPTMRISETVVPWAVLWLFYFEEWLSTGEWNGGGVHPEERNVRA